MSSRTTARLGAVAALLAVTGTLAAVILRGTADEDPAAAGPNVSVLTDEAQALAREIERLRPGRSARAAQRAVRAAMDAVEALRDDPAADADPLTQNAIEREFEYLDAVGSLLSNPRSTLKPELDDRGRRARAALQAAPGGEAVAAATRGWDDLLEFTEKRLERRRR